MQIEGLYQEFLLQRSFFNDRYLFIGGQENIYRVTFETNYFSTCTLTPTNQIQEAMGSCVIKLVRKLNGVPVFHQKVFVGRSEQLQRFNLYESIALKQDFVTMNR